MDCLERIRELLNERDWSLYRLAQVAELPQSTLTALFTRKNAPSLYTLERICKAMGITLEDFFRQENTLPQPQQLDAAMREKWKQLAPAQKQLLLDLMDQLR